MLVNELWQHLGDANEDLEVVLPSGKPLVSIVFKDGAFVLSDEYQPIDKSMLEDIGDEDEAICIVADMLGVLRDHVIENEIVREYEAEDDAEEFTVWYDADGEKLEAGDPIGFSININETETEIFPYVGLEERDEG